MRPLSNRQKLLLACALAVAVVAGLVFAVWPREPVYKGKRLTYWLDRLPSTLGGLPNYCVAASSSLDDALADAKRAEKAVNEIGPRCLSTVLGRLRSRETSITGFRYALQYKAAGFDLCNYPPFGSNPKIRRGQAVTALVHLGDTAKPVLPQVTAIAKSDRDPEVRASSLEVLRRLSLADYAQVTGQSNVVSAAQ